MQFIQIAVQTSMHLAQAFALSMCCNPCLPSVQVTPSPPALQRQAAILAVQQKLAIMLPFAFVFSPWNGSKLSTLEHMLSAVGQQEQMQKLH
jgi:hypothetical protein